jgi:hypothetical protein
MGGPLDDVKGGGGDRGGAGRVSGHWLSPLIHKGNVSSSVSSSPSRSLLGCVPAPSKLLLLPDEFALLLLFFSSTAHSRTQHDGDDDDDELHEEEDDVDGDDPADEHQCSLASLLCLLVIVTPNTTG